MAGDHRLLKKRAMPGVALAFTVFCCVSGGPFGLEPVVSESGAAVGLLLVLLLPFVWALPDALTSCELAPAIPVEGGYVVWVRRAMGEFAGFLNAWWTWIYTLVDAAIYPVLFATYLGATAKLLLGTEALQGTDAQWAVALAMIGVFAWINFRGARLVGLTSSALALMILVPFALFVVVGAVKLFAEPRELALALPDGAALRSSLAAGLGIVMWNYLGWDALSTIAEEVDDPARAYPRALLSGIATVTLVYLLPTVVGLYFYPDAAKWVEGAWPQIAEAV
jgi:amino acid transporter